MYNPGMRTIAEEVDALPGPRDPKSSTETTSVSVVIPCYNEEHFIGKALRNLADQYPPNRYEIIVVDGLSSDRTRQVIQDFRRERPDLSIKLIDNQARLIPVALNLGIDAAQGDIIARMDAHAVPSGGYIRRCVEVLKQSDVGAVGMPCRVCPGAETLTAKAIAMVVSHPFGIGDAKYRLQQGATGQEAVDTVAFAAFAKDLWRELGGYDERLLANEDYEFNYRVRQSGKKVLLDRAEYSDYFARATLGDLWRQYWRYGTWKAKMLRRHPGSMKLRHAVAPAFVASIPILLLAGVWLRPVWWLLLLDLGSYLLVALIFSASLTRRSGQGLKMMVLLPLVFLLVHLSWGASVLLGLVKGKDS